MNVTLIFSRLNGLTVFPVKSARTIDIVLGPDIYVFVPNVSFGQRVKVVINYPM
jgi:hypothetical protein